MNRKNISIFITDSDKMIRDNVAEFLLNSDYVVESFGSHKDLLDAVSIKPAQIVILDSGDNELNVIDTIHQINSLNPTIIVMVMLSNPTIKRMLDIIDVGVKNILIKPLSLNDCRKSIEKAVTEYNLNYEYQLFKENKNLIIESLENQGVDIFNTQLENNRALIEVST